MGAHVTERAGAPRAALAPVDHDFLIVGAGVCGIYQLYKLREMGADVAVLDANPDVGGTWYMNRYPGCRFDSESWSYGYSFSKDLLDEWDWSEHFAARPETLRYLEHVVERFDLRRYMTFDTRIASMTWDEDGRAWALVATDGRAFTCRFLLTALGLISARTLPHYEGMDSFTGPSFHTFDWPHEPLDLTGKRVAVIGTGATAVQVIADIAPIVGELFVLQRRPNWCAPLNNSKITPEEMARIRASYDEVFAQCAQTPGGFIHGPDPRKLGEVDPAERLAFWERLYASPGFGIWLSNYRDVLVDDEANAEFSAFIAAKIRQRVHDPVVAEKLIPTDHGFGVQRVPMETNYYEAYNLPHVHLVDVEAEPIEQVTPTGIRTAAGHYDVDVIVYATGFDAITGSYDRIDITGAGGVKLHDKWADGPRTYLGVQVAGFPNLVMLAGPQGASNSTNFPRAIESAVDWATDLYRHIAANGHTRIECTTEAEDAWEQEVRSLYSRLLLRKAKSWFTGYNSNVEGHDTMRYMMYTGGAPRYRQRLEQVEANGYEGFTLS